MLFGPEIIRIFASKEYYAAIWIIPPVAASIFFVFLYNAFVNIELYYEKNSITMLVTVVGAVLNLILNYIFIRRFGYVAAGYTTLFCYVLFAVVHGFVVNYLVKQYYPNERIHYQLIKTLSVVMLMFVLISSISYKYAILRIAIVFTVLIVAIVKRKWIMGILRKTLNK
jgi:O-antigen/teichoic acid export membrane protein